MSNKSARAIPDQIKLLKSRGMVFRDENKAYTTLKNISYYRLKGWEMRERESGSGRGGNPCNPW